MITIIKIVCISCIYNTKRLTYLFYDWFTSHDGRWGWWQVRHCLPRPHLQSMLDMRGWCFCLPSSLCAPLPRHFCEKSSFIPLSFLSKLKPDALILFSPHWQKNVLADLTMFSEISLHSNPALHTLKMGQMSTHMLSLSHMPYRMYH